MGGSTNSSTLDGHNYTYVGSTWGRIVDILMDTKIMNPIIFIDELDKVSKTENGKEIIGILTHLIDQTQNDTFQDKYFNGINLNLSKALFIFSYNDVELIDRILLDRIHRIKFDTISVEDKLIITRNFILPEIYKKMGLNEMISISDSVIEYIIQDYTSEPGVRKLKELMFEIIGEINLDILKNNVSMVEDIPIVITIKDIKMKYLKEHTEVRPTKIHAEALVGVINGLWANSVGKGGILPIEASYFPCNTFLDLKLTGMQGEVMKESMTVAKSLAWSLFLKEGTKAQTLQEKLGEHKNQGLHIHVPEGATPKDGPSAGTAITMVMYSLFSGQKIKNEVAITGEICLQGRVTAIGGLELKILGGIRAGVKTFIYPKENEKDFIKFMKMYGEKPFIQAIQFIAVERIEEVMPLIFDTKT
jgi:ATP-dependent Lon protease